MKLKMESYERILLVKPEVFVYKIPPRTTNRGYRAADWSLQTPDWTGRLRLVNLDKQCILKLEDKTNGELFAKCNVEQYPGVAVEAVTDSSRYFVIRIQDDSGRAAFIGIGFADRGDSFDLNVTLQDHFKWLQKTEQIAEEESKPDTKPQLDLGFKEGQTIKINMNIGKSGSSRPKAKSVSGSFGLLPPPPGGVKIPPASSSGAVKPADNKPFASTDVFGVDCTSGSSSSASTAVNDSTQSPATAVNKDTWGDFTSAPSNARSNVEASNVTSSSDSWVQF